MAKMHLVFFFLSNHIFLMPLFKMFLIVVTFQLEHTNVENQKEETNISDKKRGMVRRS